MTSIGNDLGQCTVCPVDQYYDATSGDCLDCPIHTGTVVPGVVGIGGCVGTCLDTHLNHCYLIPEVMNCQWLPHPSIKSRHLSA